MEGEAADARAAVSILDVLRVDLCARAILGHVSVEDLVRSERVCTRWQRAVHRYLQGCHTLGYIDTHFWFHHDLTLNSKTIVIEPEHQSPSSPSVRKLLDKWGHCIVRATIDVSDDKHFDVIASKCPNLQQIELTYDGSNRVPSLSHLQNMKHLKQIIFNDFVCFSKDGNPDVALATFLQDKNYESITIRYNPDITGSFLQSIKLNHLKSLHLYQCRSLRIIDNGILHSASKDLGNLTNLELQEDTPSMLNDVALLLKKLPQLEYLHLVYPENEVLLCEKSIEAFGDLVKLKRLTLRGRESGVNDAFLEVLARGCTKLELLEIHEWTYTSITVRGVAALCRRSPAAVTTLDFSGFNNTVDDDQQNIFDNCIRDAPLYQELAGLGCVELTLEWFRAAARDRRGRRLALAPAPAGGGGADPGDLQELKLKIW